MQDRKKQPHIVKVWWFLYPALLFCTSLISDENRVAIVASAALLPLLMLCQSADVEVARLACACTANLAEDPLTHRPIIELANGMHHLCYLMRSKHLSVHR